MAIKLVPVAILLQEKQKRQLVPTMPSFAGEALKFVNSHPEHKLSCKSSTTYYCGVCDVENLLPSLGSASRLKQHCATAKHSAALKLQAQESPSPPHSPSNTQKKRPASVSIVTTSSKTTTPPKEKSQEVCDERAGGWECVDGDDAGKAKKCITKKITESSISVTVGNVNINIYVGE